MIEPRRHPTGLWGHQFTAKRVYDPTNCALTQRAQSGLLADVRGDLAKSLQILTSVVVKNLVYSLPESRPGSTQCDTRRRTQASRSHSRTGSTGNGWRVAPHISKRTK